LQSGVENVMNLTQNYSFYCEELDVQTNENYAHIGIWKDQNLHEK
jgi:hypothetical protein